MIGVIFKGIRAPLIANGTIGTAVGTRIYRNQAPEDTALPCCIISIAAGGDSNTSARDEFDVDVTVKFVSDSALEAMNLAGAARPVLHRTTPALDDGWAAYDCQHETVVSYTQTEKKRQYFYDGGTYRLRATKDS